MYQQIILRNLERPKKVDVNNDINWVCDSFGFCSGRDIDKVTPRILQTLFRSVADDGSVSAERLADELEIATQRVNYHIRTFSDSGLVYRNKKQIYLREGSLRSSIEEMRRDANKMFDRLLEIADEIDLSLGMKGRE